MFVTSKYLLSFLMFFSMSMFVLLFYFVLKAEGLFAGPSYRNTLAALFQQSELNSTSRETPTHNSLQVTTNKPSSSFLSRLSKMN